MLLLCFHWWKHLFFTMTVLFERRSLPGPCGEGNGWWRRRPHHLQGRPTPWRHHEDTMKTPWRHHEDSVQKRCFWEVVTVIFIFVTDRVFIRLCFVPWDDRNRRVSLAEGRIRFIQTFRFLHQEGCVFICVYLCVCSWQITHKQRWVVAPGGFIFTFFNIVRYFHWFHEPWWKQSGIFRGLIFMSVWNLVQIQIQIQTKGIQTWFHKTIRPWRRY